MLPSNFITRFLFPCEKSLNARLKENTEELHKLIQVIKDNKTVCKVFYDKTP